MKLAWIKKSVVFCVCFYGIYIACYRYVILQDGSAVVVKLKVSLHSTTVHPKSVHPKQEGIGVLVNQKVPPIPTVIVKGLPLSTTVHPKQAGVGVLKGRTTLVNYKGPSIPTRVHPSHFIYIPDVKQSILSLTKRCTNCTIKCPTELKAMTSCHGIQCLCFKSNPVMNMETRFDNRIIANEALLPYEIMTLNDKPVKDMRELPDIKRSEVTVIGPKGGFYKVGEDIQIKLQLYNGYGRKVKRGGDDIRIRMFEESKQMGIAGRAKDFNNGSYIITIPTLWNGTNTVLIYIPYYREERYKFLKWGRQLNALFYYQGSYQKGDFKQSTLCSSRPNIPGYHVTCNMTFENGYDEWYCGAPPSTNLTCKDIVEIQDYHLIDLAIRKTEGYLMRSGDTFRVFAEVKVVAKGTENNERHLLPVCHRLPKSKTWDMSLPTGYVSKGKYFPTYCQINRTDADIKNCLKNTTLILTGDSTTKSWFKRMVEFTECNLTYHYVGTHVQIWAKLQECIAKNMNFKMQWYSHNLPVSILNFEKLPKEGRLRGKSVGEMLDDIPTEGKHIFVIHLYAHFARHHYYVLRERLRKITVALRRAMRRNKNLFVAVKGPSMYIKKWHPALNDYIGPFAETVTMEVFSEFRERVVYLDIWDMNMAYDDINLHPVEPMKWNMLRLLFGYACS